jgi:hypothetical protein
VFSFLFCLKVSVLLAKAYAPERYASEGDKQNKFFCGGKIVRETGK